jgi:hypothetical protein
MIWAQKGGRSLADRLEKSARVSSYLSNSN